VDPVLGHRRPVEWETASIAALLAADLLAMLSMEQPDPWATPGPGGQRAGPQFDPRKLKLLDVGTLLFFAALVIVALATSRSDVAQIDKYSQPLSSGALALIAIGSIVFGHPFTVDYAREQATRKCGTRRRSRRSISSCPRSGPGSSCSAPSSACWRCTRARRERGTGSTGTCQSS
jgi:hypothetical protein